MGYLRATCELPMGYLWATYGAYGVTEHSFTPSFSAAFFHLRLTLLSLQLHPNLTWTTLRYTFMNHAVFLANVQSLIASIA